MDDNDNNNTDADENNNNLQNNSNENEESSNQNEENKEEQANENEKENIDNDDNNEDINDNKEPLNNNINEKINTESVDENYMMELHEKLSKMKQERKDAQSQAKILNNRITMLKNQEMKNLRKIEDTKKMVNNKILRLQEMVENKKILEEHKKNKGLEVENKKNKNKILKEEMQANYTKSKAAHEKKIEEVGKISKAKKEHNRQTLDFLKQANLNENKIKYNCLKNQKNSKEIQKKLINKENRLRLKKELERKLLEECRLKEEAEAKKMEAEQEELEIIKKLHTTTQIHKNIMEEMEKLNIDSVMKGDYGFLGDNKSIKSINKNSNNKSNIASSDNNNENNIEDTISNKNENNNQDNQSNTSINSSSKK